MKQSLLIVTQKVDANDDNLGFFIEWIRAMAAEWKQVTVICLFKGTYVLPDNVTVLSLGKEQGRSRLEYIVNFYYYIIRERKKYNDVFVHMNPIYIVLGGIWWRIFGKKIALWYTHKSVDIKLRIAVWLTHIVFTASRESFRLDTKKRIVMGHGIDTDIFAPSLQTSLVPNKIVTTGRISSTKDQMTLLEAVKQVTEQGIRCELDIIGESITDQDALYKQKLMAFVEENNLISVRFLGSMPHEKIQSHISQAVLFINLSSTGSLDKAVLEAMACEVPVISSNEAFSHVLDQYGLMIPPHDPMALSEKIQAIYKQPEKYKNIGRELRSYVITHHSLKRLIEKIGACYSERTE